MEDRSRRFINTYNQLDQYMRDYLNADKNISHNNLIDLASKKSSLFRNYKNDLKEFAQLRNAIVHNTHFVNKQLGEIIAEPHEDVVAYYEDLLKKITLPKLAKDIYRSIKSDKVLTATLDTKIIDIIKYMYNKKNTCVPILEAYKLKGVFSENVLITLIAKGEKTEFNELKAYDILEYLDIDSHYGEYFAFCKASDNIFDIKEMFQKQDHKKRLELIFVTANGYQNEEILGVISTWDLVGV